MRGKPKIGEQEVRYNWEVTSGDGQTAVRVYRQGKRWINSGFSECTTKARDVQIVVYQSVQARQEMDNNSLSDV